MLRLMLFRHAKASWDDTSLADEDRPLMDKGRDAASGMGALLAERGLVPDVVLCSHARRTRQTLDLAIQHWMPRPEVRTTPGLYGATNDTYLDVIRVLGTGERLMLVGHNPAIEETARALSGQGSEEAVSRLMGGFKPGAVAVIEFQATAWSDVAPDAGELRDFVIPE